MSQPNAQLRSVRSIKTERRQAAIASYAGIYWGADFLGFAVAIFFAVVYLGIVGAIVGSVGYQLGAHVPKGGSLTGTTQTLGIGGLVGGLVAIFLAYLIGGYAAGRMARFDGVKNGVAVVIWTVLIAVVLAALGALLGNTFSVPTQLHLKIDTGTLTAAGLISLAATLVVMLIASALGGMMGARFHSEIDEGIQAS